MFFLAKYGVQTVFMFPMVKRGSVDLAVAADWTPAAADSAISKDGGSYADTTNTVSAVGGSPTRAATGWKITLTATELQAASIDLQIIDAATKAVEDQWIKIYTYGHASAKIPLDLSVNLSPLLPAALVSGRMDSSVGAVAANAITDAAVSSDMDSYAAKVWLAKDSTTTDRYLVAWYKNGQLLLSGITLPKISVFKSSDASDLITETAMTEIGTKQRFKYDEATNKLIPGATYFADVKATIDGSVRNDSQPVMRDAT